MKNIVRLALRPRVSAALAAGFWIFVKVCAARVVRFLQPCDGIDRSLATAIRLMLGTAAVRAYTVEENRIAFARDAFANISNETLARYALPEAAAALATSDPNRALDLMRGAQNSRKEQSILGKWTRVGSRLSPNYRLSLAATSAYLGDAEGVAFFTTGLRHPGTDDLKRRFAEQCRTARHLGVKADYPSVRTAVLSVAPTDVQKTATTAECAKFVETLDPDLLLAAATEGPVWLLVRGSFGKEAYRGQLLARSSWHGSVDYPFLGNVRPLFLEFHIADPEILDDASLTYLRRFAPIGCRDLFTARLLRGAGVDAFIGESELPQSVSEAVLEGQSEAKVRALWRKATTPAMARTDTLIAEVNAKYPLPEVRVADLRLDRVPVQSFGPKGNTKDNDTVQLLFNFDDNHAKFFPGAFEGIWRHATRPFVVHVFGRGLTATMFEGWTTQFPGTRFVWRDLSNVTLGDVYLAYYITVSTMDRLLAPALLPDVEKVVYLDVDILVRKDISELFDLELGDAPLAARTNLVGTRHVLLYNTDNRITEERRKALHDAFFSGETVFEGFNAGVMVMNLAQMRLERAVEKTLAIAQASECNDQLALNLYARRHRVPLDLEWNFPPNARLPSDPAIIHFIGPSKPWSRRLSATYMFKRVEEWATKGKWAGFRTYRNEWRDNADKARERGRRH